MLSLKNTEAERKELKQEQACVRKVLPLIKNQHLLLVTLLLMNSVANEVMRAANARAVKVALCRQFN